MEIVAYALTVLAAIGGVVTGLIVFVVCKVVSAESREVENGVDDYDNPGCGNGGCR